MTDVLFNKEKLVLIKKYVNAFIVITSFVSGSDLGQEGIVTESINGSVTEI